VTNALMIAFGLCLLVIQGMVQRLVVSEQLCPMLVVPLVLHLAVGEFSLSRGATLAFVLGYLTDVASSMPLGLYTFTIVALFLFARLAGLKLFLHGMLFQIALTFLGGLVVGLVMLGLHVIFERTALAVRATMVVVASQSVATALVSPLVFAVARRLPGVEAPRTTDRN